ncbi:MAG: DNA polymerase III subunit tau [Chromatiales bacterium USCg_Taylor]|nr:MAG: DNA polymerase III subunit tau [Chromatiales bacterium USCg_Taylor]
MSYRVLARKWRPRRFEELVGQEHVVRALTNALNSGRIHHAYLFTGTRGIGKTTVARILAKALNCEAGVSPQPCGACTSCTEIDDGRFIDLIEVDAASRTRVDETRELLENVPYAPTRGRFKVYLVDEVHMFSNHSFNALLKTLEEPPPHVKFLLATTEPKKLPVTILSRCLQFNLKRIPQEILEQQLERILKEENVSSDTASRRMIAEAADGSVRDALSLLDQAIAYGGGSLLADDIGRMLGTVDRGQVVSLLQSLANRDAQGLLRQIDQLAALTPDFEQTLAEVLGILHRIAVSQMLPDAEANADDEDQAVRVLATRLTPEDCQLFYQTALIGRRDLAFTPNPRRGFEMVMLRMLAFSHEDGSDEKPRARSETRTPAPAETPIVTAPATASGDAGAWQQLIDELALSGLVRELAMQCVPADNLGPDLHLVAPPAARHLVNDKIESRLAEALQNHYGRGSRLKISVGSLAGRASPADFKAQAARERRAQAQQALENDPNVQALREAFGAEVDPATIRAN